MKRWLIVAAGVAVLALLVASLATPVFAQDPDAGDAEPVNGTVYEKMHQACTEGDWEAMTEAAEEVHGGDFSGMPCHEATTDAGGSGMMGGDMMGDRYR